MAYIGTSPSNGVRRRFVYEATASQTSFSGNDESGITLTYVDSLYLDVFQNGIKLKAGDDYTATTGTTVVLVQGASANDVVEMVAFDVFSVNDSVSASAGGSFAGNVAMAGTLGVTGVVTANGGAVFNELSADVDFRVESNITTNALFVDGATGVVGVGVTPQTDWASAFEVIQYGQAGVLWANNNDNTARIGMNVKYDGALKYINTNKSTNLTLDSAGEFLFEVAPSGSAGSAITYTSAMKIHNNGVVSAPLGIALGVGTANTASNVLDDYEEGTWTPQIADSAGNVATVNAGNTGGSYTKIGNIVTLTGRCMSSSVSGVGNPIFIKNLPFTAISGQKGYATLAISEAFNLNITAGRSVVASIAPGAVISSLRVWDHGGGNTGMTAGEWSDDGYAMFSGSYTVA